MNKSFTAAYWSGRPTEDWMFSDASTAGAAWNEAFWNHEGFNELLKKGRIELNPAKRREIHVEMQRLVRDKGGEIVFAFAADLHAASKKLHVPDKVAANWEFDGFKESNAGGLSRLKSLSCNGELGIMSKIFFMEVIDRTLEGQYMSQEKFDLEVFFPELSKVIDKYKIQYDPDICVPDDDDLADRVFQAGLEFYQNVGTYCVDTERIVRFTEGEISAALKSAAAEVYFGEGKDRRRLVGRKPDSSISPFCFLGAGGVSVSSDELFIKLVQAYGEIDIADSLTMPSMIQVSGRRIRPNSPLEVMAAIYSTRLMREGLTRAGRPGMPTMNAIACASSDIAKVAGSLGLRPTDGWMIGSTAELKIETPRLNEIAYVRELGGRIVAETAPLLGGYCGGPEGVAVASVAYHLHAMMILRGDCQLHAPLHIKHVCATDPRVLWALSLGAQAITRNSHHPLMISPFMAAGPMEEMCFFETAAAVTAIVASGSNLEGLITHGGATTDLLGPLTTQFSGEVAHAVVGMGRKQANQIVGKLCEKYKGNLANAPKGKTYQQAYDVKTGKPLPESLKTYKQMKKVIADYGISV